VHHHHNHAPPADGSRLWQTADGLHLDVRGLADPAETVLRTLDSGDVDSTLVAHFENEPISLYPDLEERGWSHESVDQHCGTDCEGGFMLRMVRWGR
jgi:hypothetical protein